MQKGSLINKIKKQIEKNLLFKRRERILIACSGGVDSVVMTEILRVLAPAFGWQLFVCHVNHNIRGNEATEDALWVGNFCRMRGLEYCVENVNVPKFSSENGYSIEEAARILRYQALNKVASEKNLSVIAVAHNMEDNAETVLMNTLRGSGIDGLTGIKQKIGNVVRPLLSVSREEIEAFAQEQKISFRTDSSNKNKKHLRNKIRLELLPGLKKYNPEIVSALCRMAGILEKDAEFLHKAARSKFIEASHEKDGVLKLSLNTMKNLDDALLTRVLLFAVRSSLSDIPNCYVANKHITKLAELVREGKTGTILELPGRLKVKKDYQEILFSLQPFERQERERLPEQILSVPGRVVLPDGRILRASLFRGTRPPVSSPAKAVFPAYVAKGGLLVRGRVSGDIFRPSGMKGQRRKLKDFLIDSKIPVERRDGLPLVFDREGLLWIAGVRCAHRESGQFVDNWLYLELLDKEYINV